MMYTIETKSNNTPELNQYIIKNEGLGFKAIMLPNLGASLQHLSINNVEIIDGISLDSKGLDSYNNTFKSAIIFPFFGRIPKGHYRFKNKSYYFKCNSPDQSTAIHGHLYNKSFKQTHLELSADHAKIIFEYLHESRHLEYPFPYKMTIGYFFSNNTLNIDVEITNLGTTALPFGLGWHPYFKTESLEKSQLNFRADKQVLFNEKLLPEGNTALKYKLPFRVQDHFLDDGFVLEDPAFEFDVPEYKFNLQFSSPPPNSYLQAYIPENRKSIALEPLTCVPNCLNNGIGLQEIQSKNTFSWKVQMNFQFP